MRSKDDQNLWNFVFSVLFAVLLWGAGRSLYVTYGGLPQGIDVFDAILVALAVFRVTRLLVYDKITRWFRELFMHRRTIPATGSSPAYVELMAYSSGPLRTIYELLRCPWCIGVWAALVVVYAYFMYNWAWYVILILAIAGAASWLQLLTNGIGWRAEMSKLQVLEKEKGQDSAC